ncbi:MAG: hypothetical protein WCG55_03285 [bacterium]
MTVYQLLGYLSAIIFTIGYIPYVISIAKGKTKPHPFSWMLWTIAGLVSTYLYIQVGARETLPFAFAGCILPFIITCISFRNWEGGFSLFDYLCFGCSLLAIVTYVMFHSANFSLTISLCADAIAFLPTMRKTYQDASTESLTTWKLFLASYILSLFATLPRFSYGVVLFPAYLSVCGTIMCWLIFRGRLKKAS